MNIHATRPVRIAGSTPQDKALAQLAIARDQVKEMLDSRYMSRPALDLAMKSSLAAVTLLAAETGVSNPLFEQMSDAVSDSLKAISMLRTGWDVIKYIDNGMAHAVQLDSLRSARRLLASAYRSAATGTDT